MSYLLFIAVSYLVMAVAAKGGFTVDDTSWICLAILTAGEAIAISVRGKRT